MINVEGEKCNLQQSNKYKYITNHSNSSKKIQLQNYCQFWNSLLRFFIYLYIFQDLDIACKTFIAHP